MGCYKQINKKKKIPGESGERKVVGARRRRRRGGGGKKKRVEPKRDLVGDEVPQIHIHLHNDDIN